LTTFARRYNFYTVTFEFGAQKSTANKAKHGIDFVEAQVLWAGQTIQLSVRSDIESRTAVIGLIGSKHWTAIVTVREQNVRIISVRRSRGQEVEFYEQQKASQPTAKKN
jgi:uncharacterized protein